MREHFLLLVPLLIAIVVFVPVLGLFFIVFLAAVLDPVLKKPPIDNESICSSFAANVPIIRGPPFYVIL